MKQLFLLTMIILFFGGVNCETEEERRQREYLREQARIEREAEQQRIAEEQARRREEERLAEEARLAEERRQQEIYDMYINNSLKTGSTPYCYGRNYSCSEYGCSEIKVRTPYNSDVIVTIKKDNRVFRHAYINANDSYTLEIPNGTYQTFFYYGKGWNPTKKMKEASCGLILGGFVSNELFGKDSPTRLNNNILEYELILRQDGNFSTQPSNASEAF